MGYVNSRLVYALPVQTPQRSVFHDNNHISCVARKTCLRVFPTRSDSNRAVRPQDMARGLKFRGSKEEGSYYVNSEKNALIS